MQVSGISALKKEGNKIIEVERIHVVIHNYNI